MRCILALFPGHRQAACRGPQSLQEHGKHDPYGPQRAQIMLHLRQDCLIQAFKEKKKMSLLVYVGASKRLVIMHKALTQATVCSLQRSVLVAVTFYIFKDFFSWST